MVCILSSNTIAMSITRTGKASLKTAVELKQETGAHIEFINLSGGIGIPTVR